MITIMTPLTEHNNQLTTLKVRVTLKVQCKTSIHVMSALKLIDNSKVLKLLGTNDPHHDTICNA
jgi:hypothetical protein